MKENNILKSPFQGFSLIELSIVILIISLIVVAIIGGQKLMNLSKLSAARALTNSSPVAGIEDLSVWLETTSKNSFNSSQRINGAAVSTWYDINPQLTDKFIFTAQTSNGLQLPTYTDNLLNGLPALTYNNSNLLSSTLSAARITSKAGENTIFAVVKYGVGNTSDTGFFFYGDTGPNRIGFSIEYPTMFWNAGPCCGARISTNFASYKDWIILTGVSSASTGLSLRINGTTIASGATVSQISSSYSASINIGSVGYAGLYGGVAEIIEFSRALSSTEVGYVEQYLSKKWKLPLS